MTFCVIVIYIFYRFQHTSTAHQLFLITRCMFRTGALSTSFHILSGKIFFFFVAFFTLRRVTLYWFCFYSLKSFSGSFVLNLLPNAMTLNRHSKVISNIAELLSEAVNVVFSVLFVSNFGISKIIHFPLTSKISQWAFYGPILNLYTSSTWNEKCFGVVIREWTYFMAAHKIIYTSQFSISWVHHAPCSLYTEILFAVLGHSENTSAT